MKYLMVLPVGFYRLSAGKFAVESAFAEHLRKLRDLLEPHFDEIIVAGSEMPREVYERSKDYLAVIHEEEERISYRTLCPGDAGGLRFLLFHLGPALWKIAGLVRQAGLVHAGVSYSSRAIEFPALVFAWLFGKKSICVTDIDNRRSAWMNYRAGRWSSKSYFLCRYVYDPLRNLQLRIAAKICSLLFLKGRKLVEDYGRGKSHVKYILDAAHFDEHVIDEDALERKITTMRDPAQPLEIVYFGRLTGYKGIDCCIRAVKHAKAHTTRPVRLNIIGAGEEDENLRKLVRELGVEGDVKFHGAVAFGPELFSRLHTYHLLLAAPLSEDTPRSALDANASGIPILAFDTYYYKELADAGTAAVVPWSSIETMAERIAAFNEDRDRLVPMMRNAVEFARQNTQEIWLERRRRWTLGLFGPLPPSPTRQAEKDERVISSLFEGGVLASLVQRVQQNVQTDSCCVLADVAATFQGFVLL